MKLRQYQLDTIANTRQAVASLPKDQRHVLIQMPTGSGKTFTSGELITRAVDNGSRVLFVADRLELVEQALAAFDKMGLECGVIQGQHERTKLSAKVQVCSQATLANWLKRGHLDRYDVDIVIHDECDVQYKVRDMLADKWPKAIVIGLSATPFSKGLGDFFHSVVSSISMSDMVDQGYLSKYRIFAPSQPDMKGVAMSGKDWKAAAAAAMYDGQLVADIVQTWKRLASYRPTLCFACNVAHSKAIVESFVEAGVNAVHVDGYPTSEDDEERHSIIARYKAGDIEVLSSVALCARGFDAPETSALIIARPTKSLSLYMQIVGRALRTSEGKEDAIILDHAGCALRHGFPTDVTDFELDTSEKRENKDARKKGEKLPVPCSACHFMKPPGTHRCPNCLFAPEKKNTVVNVDGELVELSKVEKKEKYSESDKERWMKMFKAYEVKHQKANGYSVYLYRDKFGTDPVNKWPETTQEPSSEVLGWIKHQNIRKAKRRAKAA